MKAFIGSINVVGWFLIAASIVLMTMAIGLWWMYHWHIGESIFAPGLREHVLMIIFGWFVLPVALALTAGRDTDKKRRLHR